MLAFIDLFAGIGGMSLGLERAGLRCIAQIERDPYRRAVLRKNFPHAEHHADIRNFDGRPYHQRADLVAFGDPCQRNANCWRFGTGEPSPADQALRVLDEICPWLVVRENPSAVRKDAEWPWQRMRYELERRGYAVLAFRLRACCVGADHRRDRLFLLAEIPYSHVSRLERDEREEMENPNSRRQDANAAGPVGWNDPPAVRTVADGLSDGLAGRRDCLDAIGDAVVPHVAEWIGRRILEAA